MSQMKVSIMRTSPSIICLTVLETLRSFSTCLQPTEEPPGTQTEDFTLACPHHPPKDGGAVGHLAAPGHPLSIQDGPSDRFLNI